MELDELKIKNIVKGMSDEELNLSVAVKMGWTYDPSPHSCDLHWSNKDRAGMFREDELPDFINDLNIMRRAEEYLFELPDGVTQKYIDFLSESGGWSRAIDRCTFADCKDRAIAFIRTMEWYQERIKS